MQYPPVHGYGDFEVEEFDSYFARWPKELSAIPRQVVQDWIYRHWRDFSNHWTGLAPHTWSYEIKMLSSAEILSIDHIGKWISELDAEGVEYVSNAPRSQTRMATTCSSTERSLFQSLSRSTQVTWCIHAARESS